ncbi:MAG: NrpR regulatory domain-containing protein [Armatimonadota bacterium]|nr:NrpR regulatory domain-containing protein [Armatimonadota bacterium]
MRGTRSSVEVERKLLAILRVLAASDEPIGARAIATQLKADGIELSERTVRYHLRLMDERGMTSNLGEPGRLITDRGREEIEDAGVSDRLGFVISKIDSLAYRATFDMDSKKGEIILNVSLVPEERFEEALDIMRDVFRAGYAMSELVIARRAGERIGAVTVPKGMVGFGTVCTVTLNSVLLSRRIPVESKYAGLLEIYRDKPLRFTHLVAYSGSTVDPTEMFVSGRMTSVKEASLVGRGRILASFREVPAVAESDLQDALDQYRRNGLGGILAVGKPSQPLLEVPVARDRIGLAVVAGLTPVAALTESGIPVQNKAMSTLVDFSDLVPVHEL